MVDEDRKAVDLRYGRCRRHVSRGLHQHSQGIVFVVSWLCPRPRSQLRWSPWIHGPHACGGEAGSGLVCPLLERLAVDCDGKIRVRRPFHLLFLSCRTSPPAPSLRCTRLPQPPASWSLPLLAQHAFGGSDGSLSSPRFVPENTSSSMLVDLELIVVVESPAYAHTSLPSCSLILLATHFS